MPSTKTVSDWQPIETAPKDGTVVLVLLPDSDVCHSAFFGDAKRLSAPIISTWRMAWDHEPTIDPPTHWMPCPAPPIKSNQKTAERTKLWRMTEAIEGHEWGFYRQDQYESCRICGMIRRRDKKNSPCRGNPGISLRSPLQHGAQAEGGRA